MTILPLVTWRPRRYNIIADFMANQSMDQKSDLSVGSHQAVRIRKGEFLQFHSKHFSQVLQFVIPYMVSGPDYNPEERWRRVEGSAVVTPREFTSGFARRVEAQCRANWEALPIVRSVAYKFTAEHTMSTVLPFFGQRNSAMDTRTTQYIQAAQKLYHHLHHGFTGKGVHRVPIAGDTTKLPYATGLTPVEKRLAWAQHFLASSLGGSLFE